MRATSDSPGIRLSNGLLVLEIGPVNPSNILGLSSECDFVGKECILAGIHKGQDLYGGLFVALTYVVNVILLRPSTLGSPS